MLYERKSALDRLVDRIPFVRFDVFRGVVCMDGLTRIAKKLNRPLGFFLLKGFSRKVMAPFSMAFTARGTSPWPKDRAAFLELPGAEKDDITQVLKAYPNAPIDVIEPQ